MSSECAEKRFTQPLIEHRPREQLVKLLHANERLLEKVEKELAPKIELAELAAETSRRSDSKELR
jgi:hypothetical protein